MIGRGVYRCVSHPTVSFFVRVEESILRVLEKSATVTAGQLCTIPYLVLEYTSVKAPEIIQ
jgi:hypothetical protein